MLPNEFESYLLDGQQPAIIEKAVIRVRDYLRAEEILLYVTHQKNPFVTIWPTVMGITNQRCILMHSVKLGMATDVEFFEWSEIPFVQHKEGLWNSGIQLSIDDGSFKTIKELPKNQARRAYQLIQDQLRLATDHPFPERPSDPTEKLHLIKTWYENNLIDLEEYQNKKKELLNQL